MLKALALGSFASATLALAAISSSAAMASAEPVTVDHLTCKQATKQVAKSGRYYEPSRDGALPIYPVYPMPNDSSGPYKCGYKERVWPVLVETTDNDECEIGYQCSSN
jgi:hypothetical protein